MDQGLLNFGDERKIYTVTELNKRIKGLLSKEIGSVWISGEVSRPVYHASGHVYFTLKDKASQVSVACFKREASKLKFRLEQGSEVLIYGEVSVYEPRGDYQIIAEKIEPRGLGALQLAFMQLREKLSKEGFFDESRKRRIPLMPSRIGIVTSPSGAAIRDILNIINRRFPDAHITIYPASVQGASAAVEIAEGIKFFSENEDFSDVEVLIVGRGGGSIEDLWCFNEEIVARAIYASRIPVISAVGHEIDYTISDFVADLRAPTPSAAAEMVLPEKSEVLFSLENYKRRLGLALKRGLESNRMALSQLGRAYAFRNIVDRLRVYSQRVDELARLMDKSFTVALSTMREKIKASAARLESLSPLKVLARGYSVTTKASGALIGSIDDASENDLIQTLLKDGRITSRVHEVVKNDEKEA